MFMRLSKISFLLSVLLISACTMPGEIARGVDPQEGKLVQDLIMESCPTATKEWWEGGPEMKQISHEIQPGEIAVLDIEDGPDGARIASVRVWGTNYRFSFAPPIAMIACDEVSHLSNFVRPSKILFERLDDSAKAHALSHMKTVMKQQAEIEKRREEARQRRKASRPLVDATFPIHVNWNGMDGEITGSIREVRVGSQGTMAIELPEPLGTCTGEYTYTANNVGTWNISCPNNLSASGSFKSGQGAHGSGMDNQGRAVSYRIDIPN